MSTTIDERERCAYIKADAATLGMLMQCEDELLDGLLTAEEARELTEDRDNEHDRAEKAEGLAYGRSRLIVYTVAALRMKGRVTAKQRSALADLLDFYDMEDNVPAKPSELGSAFHQIKDALS